MRRVYADNAATTRPHPDVVQAMGRVLGDVFGNPSSLHHFGRAARKAAEEAREHVARLIGARPQEVFFTSGGTEADNWALRGVMHANREKGRHLVTTAVEHHAVLDAALALEKEGFGVTILPVDEHGMVHPEQVAAAVTEETMLVSVILANNEIGTVNPVAEIARAVKAKKADCVVHTDAVQAVGAMPVDVQALGVDLLSFSAHKIYGPKGAGALWVNKGFRFAPWTVGGGQERRMRPGTENLPGIVGLGKAAELAAAELAERAAHMQSLRDRFIEGLFASIPDIRLNGHPTRRHPGNVNISVAGVEGEAMLLNLDLKGVAASSGSACTSGSIEPSHVVLALGVDRALAYGSVRFSFGRENTVEDVDYILEVFPPIVARLRRLSPAYAGRGAN